MTNRDGDFLLTIKDEDGKAVEAWRWEVFKDFNVDKALFEEYRQFTLLKHKDLAPYDEYVRTRGLRWPVVRGSNGNWNETPRRFVEGDDPYVKRGMGIAFYMDKGKENRANVIARPYTPPPEVPDKEYPFWLCTGRVLEHWHTGTMTRRVKQLYNANPRAYVELNPEDARQMGVYTGEKIRIVSRRGNIVLPVSINGRSVPQKGRFSCRSLTKPN